MKRTNAITMTMICVSGGDEGGEGFTAASTMAIENLECETLAPRSFLSLSISKGLSGWVGSGVRGLWEWN
jgi:hypothetical protein